MPPKGYRQLAFKKSLLSLARQLCSMSGGLYESEVDLFRDAFRKQLFDFLRVGLITREELHKAREAMENEMEKYNSPPAPE